MQMPRDLAAIHIVGIGGIGMSAIAEILHAQGFTVQGSDQRDGANVRRLKEKGINVFIGHRAANLVDAGFVVISTAVKDDNAELQAARARGQASVENLCPGYKFAFVGQSDSFSAPAKP